MNNKIINFEKNVDDKLKKLIKRRPPMKNEITNFEKNVDDKLKKIDENLGYISHLCESTKDYVLRIMRCFPDCEYPATFYRKSLKWYIIIPNIISVTAIIIAIFSIIMGRIL